MENDKKLELAGHVRRLEKHIKEFGGDQTASDLSKMADSFSEKSRKNNNFRKASYLERQADQLDDAAHDTRLAHEAVKKYGAGHDMSVHGEGKPHGNR